MNPIDLEPSKKVTITSFFGTGWGVVFIASALLSLIGDTQTWGVVSGSYALGWIFVTFIFLFPSIGLRALGGAPIHKALAFVWCFVAYVAWVAIHSLRGIPATPNLTMLAALVLCWRLLTHPRYVDATKPENESVHRYYFRIGDGPPAGPLTLDEIRAVAGNENVFIVLASGQSSFALVGANWIRLPEKPLSQLG